MWNLTRGSISGPRDHNLRCLAACPEVLLKKKSTDMPCWVRMFLTSEDLCFIRCW